MRRNEWGWTSVHPAHSSREVWMYQETPPAKLGGWAQQECTSVAAPEDIQPGNPRATGDACLATHSESQLWSAACSKNPISGGTARTRISNHESKMPPLPGTLTAWGTDASVHVHVCEALSAFSTNCAHFSPSLWSATLHKTKLNISRIWLVISSGSTNAENSFAPTIPVCLLMLRGGCSGICWRNSWSQADTTQYMEKGEDFFLPF